jgi:hypothetical protein
MLLDTLKSFGCCDVCQIVRQGCQQHQHPQLEGLKAWIMCMSLHRAELICRLAMLTKSAPDQARLAYSCTIWSEGATVACMQLH